MKYLPRAGILFLLMAGVLLVPGASANDTLQYHWPRYTSGPALINVIPSTDSGLALDPAFFPALEAAVAELNVSSKIRLAVQPPAPCFFTVPSAVCVYQVNHPDDWAWGRTSLVNVPGSLSLIRFAQVQINRAQVDPSDQWKAGYTFCHEGAESVGLPDPSDDPVTPTVEPTCLTRDGALATTTLSAFNYQQLDTLYGSIDTPPVACSKKKCR